MRMEMESRDSGEQLREMAEKVFQLLERLKLAELAKNKAMEVRPFGCSRILLWLTSSMKTTMGIKFGIVRGVNMNKNGPYTSIQGSCSRYASGATWTRNNHNLVLAPTLVGANITTRRTVYIFHRVSRHYGSTKIVCLGTGDTFRGKNVCVAGPSLGTSQGLKNRCYYCQSVRISSLHVVSWRSCSSNTEPLMGNCHPCLSFSIFSGAQ